MVTTTPKITRGQAVGKIAGLLQSAGLSAGDRAALRRLDPEAPFSPVLWKVLVYLEDEGAPVQIDNEKDERSWAALIMCMACCIEPNRYLHDYRIPLGRALVEAAWPPGRFEQLMRARGTQLIVLLRRMAQFLASRNQPANWSDVADLIFEQEGDQANAVRLRIARSYYTHRHLRTTT